jgi:2-phosphosulfolactate phosphatase
MTMAEALCEWGPQGIEALRPRASVYVIVDVLSFSTAVDVAVSRGGFIIPFAAGGGDAALRAARSMGAALAGRRDEHGTFSLSPASLRGMTPGTRLVLPSPNGSRLSLMCGTATVLAGCLRNAHAVARAAIHAAEGGDIAVIPAGERWRSDDSLRPAVEDLIGAGAILDALGLSLMTPEARLARDAFRSARDNLDAMIRDSVSGRELMERGFAEDVDLAVACDVSRCAPVLRNGAYASY